MAAPSPWVENVEEEVLCAQLPHRIIPTGDSHESASSQVTGPSRVQRSGLRNNWYLQAVPELLQAASDHLLRAAARTAAGEIAPAPAEEP